jgi:Bacterial membrane protein YfhO
MQNKWFRILLPHAIAVIVFLLIAIVYCKPAFDGKVLQQQDVTQWKAMAQNSFQYKETHGHFPLWTEGMFSGMPGYMIAIDARVASPQYVTIGLLTLWLKEPAGYFFMACICFYFLALVLRVNPYVGIIGALTYAYATYNPVIITVGHDTKMMAIAVMPAFIAGVMLIYEKKYLWGTALTALFTACFIAANHPQIAYYGGMIVAAMTIGYAVRWIRQKDYRHLIIAGALTVSGLIIGFLCNAVVSFTTIDYAKASIRGGSELAKAGGTVTKTGLSQEYAFSYSVYKTEPFELLTPKIFGGGGDWRGDISEDQSKAIAALQNMPQVFGQSLQQFLNFYWGDISDDTGGPAYAGAVVCLLAFIGLFLLDGRHKWWMLGIGVFSILLSWGENFSGFNGLMMKVLPGYNNFRAPSVILVIPNFLLCVLAMLGLQQILTMAPADKAVVWAKFKKGLYLTGGIFVVLLLLYFSYDYKGKIDQEITQFSASLEAPQQEYVHSFLAGLRADRQTLFLDSIGRSFLYIVAAAVIAGLAIKGRLRPMPAVLVIGALAFIDLIAIDVHYLNSDVYKDEEEAQNPFSPTPADQQVLQDKGYYRVFDLRQGGLRTLTYGATTSWFHRSIGGYHPAKLSIYEDLIEQQLDKFPNCLPVINMLNTKYIFQQTKDGKEDVVRNPDALGAVWFVRSVRFAAQPQQVMDALTGLNTKDTAVVFDADHGKVIYDTAQAGDSIQLTKNDNDEMDYSSVTSHRRFAVFSEVYYDRGWKAYIDGAETPIIRTNYMLRGLSVPAGKHEIRFVFHPAAYYTGRTLQILAGIVLLALLVGAVAMEWRNTRKI